MPLDELREAREMTQVHWRNSGVNQAAVPKLEGAADMYVEHAAEFC